MLARFLMTVTGVSRSGDSDILPRITSPLGLVRLRLLLRSRLCLLFLTMCRGAGNLGIGTPVDGVCSIVDSSRRRPDVLCGLVPRLVDERTLDGRETRVLRKAFFLVPAEEPRPTLPLARIVRLYGREEVEAFQDHE